MKRHHTLLLPLLAFVLAASPAAAQDAAGSFGDDYRAFYESATRKIIALAEAMPQDKYDWRPAEGIMSVSEVLMHVARYNYYLPQQALGVDAPADVDLASFEETTDKDEVVARLRQSVAHVQQVLDEMPEARYEETVELYGRTATGRTVLLQLLNHLSEHVGQTIAYARMNGVAPPWSR